MANILTDDPGYTYHEKTPKIDAKEFQKVIDSRRSVRIYEKDPTRKNYTAVFAQRFTGTQFI